MWGGVESHTQTRWLSAAGGDSSSSSSSSSPHSPHALSYKGRVRTEAMGGACALGESSGRARSLGYVGFGEVCPWHGLSSREKKERRRSGRSEPSERVRLPLVKILFCGSWRVRAQKPDFFGGNRTDRLLDVVCVCNCRERERERATEKCILSVRTLFVV